MREELGEGFDHLRQAATHAAAGVGAAVGPRMESARGYVGPGMSMVRDATQQSWDSAVTAVTPLVAAARTGAATAGEKASKKANRASRKATKAGRKATKATKAATKAALAVGATKVGAKMIERKSSPPKKRGRTLVGLLAVGAAVGAVAALLARRRDRAKWAEYESQGLESVRDEAKSALDATKAGVRNAADDVATTAERMSGRVGDMADSAKGTASSMAGTAAGAADTAADRTGGVIDAGKTKTDQLIDKATPSKNNRG
jgi:hypothetical protein